MLAHSIWLQNSKHEFFIQRTSGNWRPDPSGPKMSKRIRPEGIPMDEKTLAILLCFMVMTLRIVESVDDEIRKKIATSREKSP
jgi:hypothetical protein